MAVNLDGTFNVLRAAARVMVPQGSGAIVTVSSSAAFDTLVGYGPYAASKAGAQALSQAAAKELAAFGVRLNVVAPGPVDTPMAGRTPAGLRQAMSAPGVRGYASPEEIADSICYLAGPGAANVVGAVLLSNGGRFTVVTRPDRGARMAGKCALVTGATGGIGCAISELLHESGATVYLTDIDRERGESLAGSLGERARFVQLDVTDEASWSAAAALLEDAGDRLTTLVNCAGAALRRPLADTSVDDFRRIVELNLVGTFLGVRLAARHMVDGGAIVNISSLNGVLPTAGLGAYVASKSAVSALTRVAALELADRGITVNAVCPGSIDTAITDSADFADTDWDAYLRTIPVGRRGAPVEVAQAVLYLASDESRYVTGTNLVIDGGIAAGRMSRTTSESNVTSMERIAP